VYALLEINLYKGLGFGRLRAASFFKPPQLAALSFGGFKSDFIVVIARIISSASAICVRSNVPCSRSNLAARFDSAQCPAIPFCKGRLHAPVIGFYVTT
jgi:hypothetical protein